MKAPSPQLQKALVTEVVVGRLGSVIGAPVCRVEPIVIGTELLPCEIRPGVPLLPGIGSATENLGGTVTEIRPNLNRRYDDDNRVRHAGVYALVDWFIGSDLQWLQRVDADWELHSHDHGWYLPPSGPNWTAQDLKDNIHVPALPPDDPADLDPDEVVRLAEVLEGLQRTEIALVLREVPPSMPVSDSDLECLGWFLEERAPLVAARLRAL